MNQLYISRIITAALFCWSVMSGYGVATASANAPFATDPFANLNAESLTPEKLQEFEAQLNAEIEDMVNNMKPEQKKIFDETVKRLEQKDPEELQRFVMGDMNDAEMEDFLKSVIPEDALQDAPEAGQEIQPEPAEAPKADVKPQFSSKHEKAKHLIEKVIKHTESFLQKTTEIPELENFVKQWKDKGLKCMPAVSKERANNWTKFKAAIDDMNNQFYRLLEKDSKKDSYKYLEDFINNESLYEQVTQLHDSLTEQEPKIETSPFGTKEISNACQLPVQNVINTFADALDEIEIPRKLEVIFQKYEPTAKKHREAEQKATDKALQESKQKPSSKPMSSVGSESRNPYASPYSGSGYSSPSWSSYTPSSYNPSSSTPTSNTPASTSPFGNGSSAGGKSGANGAPKPTDGKKEPGNTSDKDVQKGADKPGANSSAQKSADSLKSGTDAAAAKNYDNAINNAMEEIKDHMRNANDIAGKIFTPTLTTEPIDAALLTEELPTLVKELNDATKKVTALKNVRGSKAKIQSAWKINKSGPEKLKETIKQINQDKDSGALHLDQSHQEAFFFTSNQSTKPVNASITGKNLTVDQIKSIRTVSAQDIVQSITNLETAVNNFS